MPLIYIPGEKKKGKSKLNFEIRREKKRRKKEFFRSYFFIFSCQPNYKYMFSHLIITRRNDFHPLQDQIEKCPPVLTL